MANLFDGNDLKIVQELKQELRELKEVFSDLAGQVKKTQTSFDQQSNTQDDLKAKTKQLSDVDRELERIQKRSEKTTKEVVKAQLELTKKRRDLREEVIKENKELKSNVSFTDKLTKSFQNALLKVTTFIAVAKGVITTIKKISENVIQLNKQTTATARAFNITRDEANDLTKEIRKLSAAYEQDFNEVLKTTNILSKEFGITGSAALDLINQGFEKGANINGEFLELLKEYPAQLRTVGLSAEQTIAIITQTEREGVFSDKGIDAIKEAGIRLREMTPATKAALDAIGLSSNEIQRALTDGSKTLFQVTQDVSTELSKLPPQSKEVGTAIADIFGGPGEDAGLRFLTTLKDIDTNLGNIESSLSDVEQAQIDLNVAWQTFKDSIVDSESVISSVFSNFLGLLSQSLYALMSMKGLLTKTGELTSRDADMILNALNNITIGVEENIKKYTTALNEATDSKQIKEYYQLLAQALIDQGFAREKAIKIAENAAMKRIDQLKAEIIATKEAKQRELEIANEARKKEEQARINELNKRKKELEEIEQIYNNELIPKQLEALEGSIDIRKELEQGYTDYIAEQEEERTRKKEEEEAKRLQIEELNRQLSQAATEAANQVAAEQYNAFIEDRLNQYTEQNQREQDILKNRLDKGFITEKQYNDQVKALQLKQRQEEARAEKKKAQFDNFLDILTAVGKSIAQSPTTFGQPFAGYAIAEGAIRAAAIAARPIPKFGYGSDVLQKDTFAEIGDRYQHEAVLLPDGSVMFSDNKPQNVMLPAGAQVLSGENTREFVQDRGLNEALMKQMIIQQQATTKAVKKLALRTRTDKGITDEGENYRNSYIR